LDVRLAVAEAKAELVDELTGSGGIREADTVVEVWIRVEVMVDEQAEEAEGT